MTTDQEEQRRGSQMNTNSMKRKNKLHLTRATIKRLNAAGASDIAGGMCCQTLNGCETKYKGCDKNGSHCGKGVSVSPSIGPSKSVTPGSISVSYSLTWL